MKKQAIAPAALIALKEALTTVYWYKSDLRSFLTHTIPDTSLLSRLNWDGYKRNIVVALIDTMAQDQERFQGDLLSMMTEVARVEDFSHLRQLDDGVAKAAKAESAVTALRKLIRPHEDLLKEQQHSERCRKAAYEATLRLQGVRDKLKELSAEFCMVVSPEEPHRRGYRLEHILRDLFTLFDLDPKASFKIIGEQIDGAFTFDNTDYLLEAKWKQDPVGIQDLDAFAGKIGRKLDNTLGLYLSINGFSADAVKAHSTGRKMMILMEGSDLMAVLEERIDLLQLLLRKRRHAAQTGEILLPIHEIMVGM